MANNETVRPNQIVLLDGALRQSSGCFVISPSALQPLLGLTPPNLPPRSLRREDLGSTGLGGGIAIPHTRMPGFRSPLPYWPSFRTPIQFDAIDGGR